MKSDVFQQLVDLIDYLRSPKGCAWDRCQTHNSLKKYLIEETEEVQILIVPHDISVR